MRGLANIMAGAALAAASLGAGLGASPGPAAAHGLFAAPPPLTARDYPGAPRSLPEDRATAPYAMTYTDEAVQNLGFRDGRMDLFSTHPASHSYWPSFSGGLGGDGAMLKLQWHPGE